MVFRAVPCQKRLDELGIELGRVLDRLGRIDKGRAQPNPVPVDEKETPVAGKDDIRHRDVVVNE